MPRVIVTPRAVADLGELIETLGLPANALRRVQTSLRILKRFPLAGRALTGAWEGTRFLIGPWPWLILIYLHDEQGDAVYVVAAHDGRGSSAATNAR
ncbi:MAG: type II toxin-antitoxin system RelE/ParE family toxin [Actinobacteria bacterium]|nr:type II toxin-antitoxin system RelE/ParE family toxin [Actinomycetota bacterium]